MLRSVSLSTRRKPTFRATSISSLPTSPPNKSRRLLLWILSMVAFRRRQWKVSITPPRLNATLSMPRLWSIPNPLHSIKLEIWLRVLPSTTFSTPSMAHTVPPMEGTIQPRMQSIPILSVATKVLKTAVALPRRRQFRLLTPTTKRI